VVDRFAAARRRVETLPPLGVDTLIAVLCYLATVAVPVKVARDGGWPLFVLAALASVPLVWRRRRPVVVAALVGAGTLGLAVTGTLGSVPLPYGQLVATYTVASLAGPVWRLLVMACTGVGVLVAVLALLGQGPATLGIAGLPFVVAYAFGVGGRARKDRIGMLEERTRRLAETHEANAARERERIAREIHDIVAHSVSLIVVQAEAGLVRAAGEPRTTRTFETIAGTGREALSQLDRALGVLRGDTADRQPQPALDELPGLLGGARLAGLDTDLTESGTPRPVPADLATAVYRLVQEAVTNTVKHAAATRVEAHLAWHDDHLDVRVRDDGRGPASPLPGNGRGLVGMRERIHAYGGRVRTGPGPDGVGFLVAATLPLTPWTEEANVRG
jgi:signal transduction histidine kinase